MIYIFKDEDTMFGLINITKEGIDMNSLVKEYKNKYPEDYTYEEFLEYLIDEHFLEAEWVEFEEVEF